MVIKVSDKVAPVYCDHSFRQGSTSLLWSKFQTRYHQLIVIKVSDKVAPAYYVVQNVKQA